MNELIFPAEMPLRIEQITRTGKQIDIYAHLQRTQDSCPNCQAVVYGVDELEVGVAATTAYAVTHSGWVAIGATYVDSEGNLRVKHEVLVAGGILTTTDADDDALFLP